MRTTLIIDENLLKRARELTGISEKNSSSAAAKGLTYPFKSSVFRGIMKTSNLLGKAADMMPLVAVDVALTKGLAAELRAMKNGECQ